MTLMQPNGRAQLIREATQFPKLNFLTQNQQQLNQTQGDKQYKAFPKCIPPLETVFNPREKIHLKPIGEERICKTIQKILRKIS